TPKDVLANRDGRSAQESPIPPLVKYSYSLIPLSLMSRAYKTENGERITDNGLWHFHTKISCFTTSPSLARPLNL
ncbi:MAG: hypothetical protein J7L53_05080, partial [Deltaproteobacteria bacterium]|nr:hypothetical protein [Deltaproteobacteria bacterium]